MISIQRSTIAIAALSVVLQSGFTPTATAQVQGFPQQPPAAGQPPATGAPQENGRPLMTYIGDGLRIDILKINPDDSASGVLQRDGKRFPFTATTQGEKITGNFVASGHSYPFEAAQTDDETELLFTTGKKTYKLRLLLPGGPLNDMAPAAPVAPPAAPNPLADGMPTGPVGQPPVQQQPVQQPPAQQPFAPPPVAPIPVAPAPVTPAPAQVAPTPVAPVANPLQQVEPAPAPTANPLQQLPATPPTPAAPATVGNPFDALPPAAPAQPAPAANPLLQVDTSPAAPAQPPAVQPAQAANPLQQLPAAPQPAPQPAAQSGTAPKAALPPLVLKPHKFHDITMGNVVSHTMLVPEGWRADGHIEWSMGDVVYPQNKITLTAPDKCGLSYMPTMNFGYTEMQQAGSFPPQGTPPPKDFGQWVISFVQKINPKVSNVRLIESKRNLEMEALNEKLRQQSGTQVQGMTNEIYTVTFAYDQEGVRMREALNATYARFAPIENVNIRSLMWSVMVHYTIRAPEDRFDQMKPVLHVIARSFVAEAKWWTQMQLTLIEITRLRHEQRMAAIQARAKLYDTMTEQQHQAFKEKMGAGDVNQHNFLNMIKETSDYQNPNGTTTNLPMHYSHVFTNGQGAYLLTNNSLDKPGEFWTEVKPTTLKP